MRDFVFVLLLLYKYVFNKMCHFNRSTSHNPIEEAHTIPTEEKTNRFKLNCAVFLSIGQIDCWCWWIQTPSSCWFEKQEILSNLNSVISIELLFESLWKILRIDLDFKKNQTQSYVIVEWIFRDKQSISIEEKNKTMAIIHIENLFISWSHDLFKNSEKNVQILRWFRPQYNKSKICSNSYQQTNKSLCEYPKLTCFTNVNFGISRVINCVTCQCFVVT